MRKYLFFRPADKAQDNIWNYSVEKWGKVQAEKYIRGLHVHLKELADRKLVWRRLPNDLIIPRDLEIEAYFSRYEHHLLFFREFPNGNIGIMSILHAQADIPVQLKTDLEKIFNPND